MAEEKENARMLSEEEYEDFIRFREMMNQRVMGIDSTTSPSASILPKVKFNGGNIEEFTTAFGHIAEAYRVSNIFFTDYGLRAPNRDNPGQGIVNGLV